MASCAHTLVAPARAIPIPPTDWLADPRAVAILATCETDVPAGEWRRSESGRLHWMYVGERADALRDVRADCLRGVRAYTAATRDYSLDNEFFRHPNVEGAIDGAWQGRIARDAAAELRGAFEAMVGTAMGLTA